MARYPGVVESIAKLEAEGFPIFAYDGSLGGKYPVICVVLFNPANGTCFASFGASGLRRGAGTYRHRTAAGP
jgi:ribosomal protein S12 methylthiotransferase accessory factor